eukprot:CAMPEP_0172442046 /NCGR_PEP_ID=MMETSP1065-20121228/2515_1 /TAXON_ID=265537 /ORGANISM="Amphiprora paludosa, Strain CCMP125" /LENGTH=261 /DNA_ID=CAMNT_0013191707 /DNA_START=44 /DNA_END=829 /DNA_ORIENTATION=-
MNATAVQSPFLMPEDHLSLFQQQEEQHAPQSVPSSSLQWNATDDIFFDKLVDDVLGSKFDLALDEFRTKIFLVEQENPMIEQEMTPAMIMQQPVYAGMVVGSMGAQHQDQQDGQLDDEELLMLEKPKKSLSAYNLFFKAERQRLLQTLPDRRTQGKRKPRNSHGKLGFADMARTIASKWKQITPEERAPFDVIAKADSTRYKEEMQAWKCKKKEHFMQKLNLGALDQSSLQQQPVTRMPASSSIEDLQDFHWDQSTLLQQV